MKLFVFLISAFVHLSEAPLPLINSSILQLPSQDTILATEEIDYHKPLKDNPWPAVPYQRQIKDGLLIRITAYGDLLSNRKTPMVLGALTSIQRIISNAGEPSDVLEEITTVGAFDGNVYTEVGFYSLHPPAGIDRKQAVEVIHMVWRLVIEHSPAREITSSTILAEVGELALFRMSLRVGT